MADTEAEIVLKMEITPFYDAVPSVGSITVNDVVTTVLAPAGAVTTVAVFF